MLIPREVQLKSVMGWKIEFIFTIINMSITKTYTVLFPFLDSSFGMVFIHNPQTPGMVKVLFLKRNKSLNGSYGYKMYFIFWLYLIWYILQ